MNPTPQDRSLRIIYMGTPEFAVPALEKLVAAGWNVIAVITAPDKPQGRGQKLVGSPVKEAAERLDIPVLQPTNLKDPGFQQELKELAADLQIVVAFRMLPEAVWNMPPLGTFNLHASLLPNFRGAAPINWALIQGEKVTGVTTFFLQHEIDTGNILFQEKVTILPEDNLGSLYEKLMNLGANLVVQTVVAIANKDIHPLPQDEALAIHSAPKIFKETGKIDWITSATSIHNLIRGLSPYPGAWTELQGKSCKIFASTHLEGKLSGKAPGEWTSDFKTYLHFQCGQGILVVQELQLEGKKRMKVDELLRGWKG
ncbi:MAG: methionyl-tRNA formyltransferase [Algoriphagus sp.]|jgi:methionyl-tRNA formyltransferase|uniref:methionyl-tRNA formyltransferase n=1 Tax=Algoriphagus sp. TaxID=1872435 RepID=UPI002742A230|nr:methionyl-tRNA formyltransferase [Algoriphagus sp.]MDP4746861.1 methionyl-tRNA formyltransferase [Algoriphagus sp.]MDP4905454.1 methionyl-tRNA formyltransferase [Algoriphagus sp.]MDP4956196.1 methionyl-tRNA formyltransferase [Algoriphagus sp.]